MLIFVHVDPWIEMRSVEAVRNNEDGGEESKESGEGNEDEGTSAV